jgi:TolA-binding protein
MAKLFFSFFWRIQLKGAEKKILLHGLFCSLLLFGCPLLRANIPDNKTEQQKFHYDFLLAEKYIKEGRFQNATDTLRTILHRNPEPELEAKALIQLGRSMLLGGRTELAETTFRYFRQKFPDHPQIAEADFLSIESQINNFTNLQSFERQLMRVADFKPFGLDLDFFDFFTGFTKGYLFADYKQASKKLQTYFTHPDPLLRERAVLTDTMIRVLDFGEEGTALENLDKLKNSVCSEFAHIARAILFILACQNNLHNPEYLKKFLPEKPDESRISWLIHLLFLQITAYLHANFNEALEQGQTLLQTDTHGLSAKLEPHLAVLKRISNPKENDEELIKLARELESHSSLHYALQIYEKIIQNSQNPTLIGLAHYRMGRIYQGDFLNAELSEVHFRKASNLPLPPEFHEEITWRQIRNLPELEKNRTLQEITSTDAVFTEAAILKRLQKIDAEPIIPSVLENYYKTLLQLDLDPASQIEFLQKLADGAEAVHQYAKARYFLMRLAEFDLTLANRLLEKNFLKEQTHEAARQGLLASEPEKFAYLKGCYLILLGQTEEGQATLSEIVHSHSIYAEKARFELFRLALPEPPFSTTNIQEIEDMLNKNPDPEIQKKSAELLFRHFSSTLQEAARQKKSDGKQIIKTNPEKNLKIELEKAKTFFNRALQKIPSERKEFQQKFFDLLLSSGQIEEARKKHDVFFPDKSENTYFVSSLKLAEAENDIDKAIHAVKKLLGSDPENRDKWLQKLFALMTIPAEKPEETTEKKIKALHDFSKAYQTDFSRLFGRELIQLATQNPESELIKNLILKHGSELGFLFSNELFALLELLERKKLDNPGLIGLKINIMDNHKSAFNEEFLFSTLQKACEKTENSAEQETIVSNALLSADILTRHYKEFPKNLTIAKKLHLTTILQRLFRAVTPDFPGYEKPMELDWLLRDEESRRRRISEVERFTEPVRNFYTGKQIADLLLKENFREATAMFTAQHHKLNKKQKVQLFTSAYESMFKTRQYHFLREWQQLMARELNDSSLPGHEALTRISRHINAKTVIETLNREINWDHPQHPDNFERFLKIAELYENELEDIKSAADIYYQLHELFPNQTDAAKTGEERLIILEKAISSALKPDFNSRIEAGRIWLEKLENPRKALEIFNNARETVKNPQQEYFLIFQKIRCLVPLRHLEEAAALSRQLPPEYRFFALALSKQISALKELGKLPPLNKADYGDLLNIARIHLEEIQDIKTTEEVFNRLLPLAKYPHPLYRQGSLADLFIKFYNIALGQNEVKKAVFYLKKAPELTDKKELHAHALHLLGNHYLSFEPNLPMAESCFKAAHNSGPNSVYGQLSLYSLILLYEQENKKEKALETLQKLKNEVQDNSRQAFLEPHEMQLRKNIVLSRLEDFQVLQHSNPEFILKTARSLAWKEEYFDEAEKNYLLYYRIMENNGLSSELRREIADFYLRYEKLSSALKYLHEIINSNADIRERIAAGLSALEIIGLKMQNFTAAFEDLKRIKNLMPNPAENERLKELENQIKVLQNEQKKLNLRTLNYSHLPAIALIKKDYYRNSRYEEAAKELERLLSRTENFQLQTGIHYELARLYDLKLKNYKKAHEHYEKFFEFLDHPQISPEILLRIAEIRYEEFKDIKKAREAYEIYLRKYPAAHKRVAVLFKMAEIYARHEMQFSRALDTYTDISNSYPQTKFDETAKFEKARLLAEHMGDLNGAILVYRDLVDTNFDASVAAEALFQIARIYETQLNNRPQAISVYEEVISRFPNSSQAVNAKDQIERIRRR